MKKSIEEQLMQVIENFKVEASMVEYNHGFLKKRSCIIICNQKTNPSESSYSFLPTPVSGSCEISRLSRFLNHLMDKNCIKTTVRRQGHKGYKYLRGIEAGAWTFASTCKL